MTTEPGVRYANYKSRAVIRNLVKIDYTLQGCSL